MATATASAPTTLTSDSARSTDDPDAKNVSLTNFGQNAADLVGRVSLSAIFALAGYNKLGAYEGTAGYMDAMGVSSSLLPAVIALELLGAIAIVLGFQTRIAALALAGFSVVSAVIFHANLADQMQFLMFFKNIAMAGGFLILAANGARAWSLDARRRS